MDNDITILMHTIDLFLVGLIIGIATKREVDGFHVSVLLLAGFSLVFLLILEFGLDTFR